MPAESSQIEELALQYGINPDALRALVDELRQPTGASHFYVFWNTAGSGGGTPGGKARTIVCFRSPDAAITFAQRNHLNDGQPARLRRIGLVQLLAAMLQTPSINRIVLADEPDERADDLPAGRLPDGQVLSRADIVQRLGMAA
ncbi:MAG TPA: hypothetical protein VFT99_20305 [Roseiflexaceae bacterium]|nr:hypothetical protein [Roseiflexaceae bacterium]